MGIINIREARREGARSVLGIAGPSGSGKTHTAILLAYGMAGFDAKKIGFLDTENKRGSLYADILKDDDGNIQRFLIADLIPPFTPDRYATAIQEFQAAGVEILIIDTVTHEWEGTGGCIEIADGYSKPTVGWNKAKKAHKKFMNTLLQCDMHIICCIRAREQMNFKDPSNPFSLGIQPVQEKNFMFEMTVSLMMEDEGKKQTPIKCPGVLQNIFGRQDGYISPQDGADFIKWIDGSGKLNRKVEQYRNRLLTITEEGLIHTRDCWEKTPKEIQEELGQEFKIQLYASASDYDTLKKQAEIDEGAKAGGQTLKLKKSVTGNQIANQLHQTDAWKKYIEAKEHFPDVMVPEPQTVEGCMKAVKLINQEADKLAS